MVSGASLSFSISYSRRPTSHRCKQVVAAFPPDLLYEDFVEAGRRLALFLRNEQACDVVIALTHMRLPRDEVLSKSVPGSFLFLPILFLFFFYYFFLYFFNIFISKKST